jgi:hypothetical protein
VALVADKKLEFWAAMELSRKVVSKHWWKFLWFHLVLLLIYLAGYLCCYVGIFIAMPLCSAALAWAYQDIFGGTPPVIGNAPAAASQAPSAAPGNTGRAIAIAVVVIAAAILVGLLGFIAVLRISHDLHEHKHAHELHHYVATRAKALQTQASAAIAVSRNRNSPTNALSVPKLQFLAWQDQWQTNQRTSAWHPDGTLVTNATELKWLQAAQPSSFNVTGLIPQPRFLYVWFSSPDFRQGTFSQILLLNDGKPVKPGANADVGGSSESPNESNGNLGWVYWTLVPVEGTNHLDHLTVRLRYVDGPLEHIQYIPNSAQYDSTLENESLLGGFGQDTDSNAFVSITENGNAMKSRKFDVQAVTRDGQQLDSTGASENYLGDGNGPRVEKFTFSTPIANVAKFVVGTRQIQMMEWKNVKLPGENVSTTNEDR